MQKLLLTIDDVRQQLGGRGRGFVYELIRAGEIASIKDGSRRFVIPDSVVAYVERLRLKSEITDLGISDDI
jgi:excisionase family DNA binding protein